MAGMTGRQRKDGVYSYQVRWRRSRSRWQSETFAKGTTSENLRAAKAFCAAVEANGNDWPEGWVKGHGLVADPESFTAGAQPFAEYAKAEIGLRLNVGPGQMAQYRRVIDRLVDVTVNDDRGHSYRPFDRAVGHIREDDIRRWLIQSPLSPKTMANHHGLISGVFNSAVRRGVIKRSPCEYTSVSRRKIRESRRETLVVTGEQFTRLLELEEDPVLRDLYKVAVGTGMRFGELAALWVSDIDFAKGTVTVRKAWKRSGTNGETDIPVWLQGLLKPKHTGATSHYLGPPKTIKGMRTIVIDSTVAEALVRLAEGKEPDEFVFLTAQGRPLHHANFTNRKWMPLMRKAAEAGLPHMRFHDFRHTHASWLIGAGIPLPVISGRLGHESITTTVDVYGHLMPQGDNDVRDALQEIFAQGHDEGDVECDDVSDLLAIASGALASASTVATRHLRLL